MKTLLLHICWLEIITGKKVEPSEDQYVLKGATVCLTITEEPELVKGLKWIMSSDVIVDDNEISPKYRQKVDYNSEDHSLCIKNLTEKDSNIYRVTAINIRDWTEPTTSYRIMVLDHVPIPVMNVTAFVVNSSVGPCEVGVNCSVRDVWMLSVCPGVRGQCKPYSVSQRFSGVNIVISNQNGTFQCTASNHVSTQTVSQPMERVCIDEGDDQRSALSISRVTVKAAFVCVGLAVIIIIIRKWISSKQDDSTQVAIEVDFTSGNDPMGRLEPLGPIEALTMFRIPNSDSQWTV